MFVNKFWRLSIFRNLQQTYNDFDEVVRLPCWPIFLDHLDSGSGIVDYGLKIDLKMQVNLLISIWLFSQLAFQETNLETGLGSFSFFLTNNFYLCIHMIKEMHAKRVWLKPCHLCRIPRVQTKVQFFIGLTKVSD